MRRPARILIGIGVALLVLLLSGRALSVFYTDVLWYESVEHLSYYWTRLSIDVMVRVTAGVLAAGLVLGNLWLVLRQLGAIQIRRRYGNLEIAEQVPRAYVITGAVLIALLTGWWLSTLKFGGGAALGVAAWFHAVEWGVADPLFGKDASFYVFALPVYFQFLDYMLLVVFWCLALVGLGYVLVGGLRVRENRIEVSESARLHFVGIVATVVVLLGARYLLGRYGLMFDGHGIGGGLGYTDVHARMPAHRAMATLSMITAAALVYGAIRRSWVPPVLATVALVLGAIAAGHVYPWFVQNFRVNPNQLAREAAFIGWNMEFTRTAFGLDALDRRRFPYRRAAIPDWDAVAPDLADLPLWDAEPLRTVYQQTQSLFAYYHFPRVTFDRYPTANGQQQVAIAVREFAPDGLADGARTWQSLRLNPTFHQGNGVVVTPVSEAEHGEPVLWLGEIDPVRRSATAPEHLDLTNASVYIGQTMRHYVVLVPGYDGQLTGEPGRDFPRGVELSSFPRVLATAWRFGDKNLLFSGEITRSSHFLFRRSVHDRIRALAPFLYWDADPYPVVHEGRVVWIVDGYTATSHFPLSRAVRLDAVGRARYIRNSVKATVCALTGNVAFFAVDDEDPILATYRRIFPGLIQPVDAMPAELNRHIRYPLLLLNQQAEILKEYHLDRVEAFYAGQDYWQLPDVAGLAGYGSSYVNLRLPGEDRPEFLSLVPFIARGRLNMTAVMVARNDPPHYGELVLFELPRDQRVPGPGQVRAIIEQDAIIAQQLTLWRGRGSDVESGRLRLVPLDSTFLYVEPLYLSAQGSPIPELRRVIVSDGFDVVMAESIAEGIEALRGNGERPTASPEMPERMPLPAMDQWPRRALELLEEADQRLRRGDWAGFGARWNELRELLNELAIELH